MTSLPAGEATPSALGELRAHWSTLAGATLGAAFGAAALPFYTAGLFLAHLQGAFGWTRTDLTAIGLANTVIISLVAPLLGALVDRVGARGPAAVGFAALAASFLYMSRAPGSLVQYAAVHLTLSVLMLGSGPIGLTRPVNLAFDRMRGLALGITIGGIGATAALAPPIVGRLIATHGWRSAYQSLAIAVLCVAPLALGLLSWRRPARDPAAPAAARARAARPVLDRLFWRLVASFTLVAVGVSGFVTHFVPMLTDGGMAPLQAAGLAGLLGLGVLVGRVGIGFVIDLVFAPFVAAGVMALTGGGFVLLAVGGPAFAAPGALAVGLAMGAEVDLIAYFTARYYGMALYGRMYGLLYGAFVLGTGFSPYLIALIQAAAGSYTPALWVSAGLLGAASLLFAGAPRFEAREAADKEPAKLATAPGGVP